MANQYGQVEQQQFSQHSG